MRTYEELRIRMNACILEAVCVLHEEGGDLFTILDNRFKIDRDMLGRWVIRHKNLHKKANE